MDVLIGVEVDFFFLEGSDQPFGVSVLPGHPLRATEIDVIPQSERYLTP